MRRDPIESMQHRLQRIETRYSQAPVFHYPGRGFLYIFGETKLGKLVCLGPYSPDPEGQTTANAALADLDNGELYELDTRDLNKASRIIRNKLIASGREPDEVLKRMLHEKGYAKERAKEQTR